MSRPTKGFFETGGQTKHRYGQWPRNRNDRTALADRPTNIAPVAKPAIPASAESKAKLHAYQYAENVQDEMPEDTTTRQSVKAAAEQATSVTNGGKAADDASAKMQGDEESQKRKIPLPKASTFPSTPSDRLTLDELIGIQQPVKPPVEEQPEEILGWNPNSSGTASPGRKRKRAQSSSPGMSSPEEYKPRNPEFLQKTPMADPMADLWRRLGKDQSGGLNLALQPSPMPLETPVKGSGLRRWASAGNALPDSRSKRRRVNPAHDSNVWQGGKNGKTKVADLLEKIQESMASQKLEAQRLQQGDNPSSSSPLPEAGAFVDETMKHNGSPSRRPRPPGHASGSLPPARPQKSINAPASGRSMPSQQAAAMHKPSQPRNAPCQAKPIVQDDAAGDEFDDLDMDLTAEDLEDIMLPNKNDQQSMITSKPETRAPIQSPLRAKTTVKTEVMNTVDLTGMDDDFDDDLMEGLEDEFDLDDFDEEGLLEAEISATQGMKARSEREISSSRAKVLRSSQVRPVSARATSTPKSSAAPTRYRRLHVRKVVRSTDDGTGARQNREVVVLAEDHYSHTMTAVTLRGSWAETSLTMGDVIHVSRASVSYSADPSSSAPGQVLLDDSETSPLLVVHPDHMLSATTVADSFDCIRKAVLQDRIKATGESSKPMIYGKILHAIFQQALLANDWSEASLNDLVQSTVQAHLEGLWELGMEDEMLAIEEISSKMAEVSAWAKAFVRSIPGPDAKVDGCRDDSFRMAVTGLVAIEEHVWSPMFGLKGNVDATIQLRDTLNNDGKWIVPFEVKTGRSTNSPSHHAQTALYTLLLTDRYDVAVKAGILYYLENSKISRVGPSAHEIRQMMQQRNRLASYIQQARSASQNTEDATKNSPELSQLVPISRLPEMMKNAFKCSRCYAQTSCFAFHALAEDGNADSAGMIDDEKKDHSAVWTEAVGHLLVKPKVKDHAAREKEQQLKTWFKKWNQLLTFEEGETSRLRKELWTMSSKDRENAGRCFGNLRLLDGPALEANKVTQKVVDGIEGSGGKINKFSYILQRRSGHIGKAFNDGSQLVPGEPIVISSESGQWALANGYIIAISSHSISVAVDRKLGDARQPLPDFNSETCQSFKGVMSLDKQDVDSSTAEIFYRLDKDEFSNGLALIRNNLVAFMSSHPNHAKLRDLLIFNKAPMFANAHLPQTMRPSQLGEMNEDQRAAAKMVIEAEDYALVLGMPGTGKTTTIAHLIRALLADNKTILLTSYTHTAVDNILLKIRDTVPEGSVLRLGIPTKINAQVKEFCHLASTTCEAIDEIDRIYMNTQIVATTCMGTNHAVFSRRTFDVCIVDEASQITLPISLGPLLYARKFILVGDHYQLPPLVQNKAAAEGGLDISLFRQLSEHQPDSIAMLGKQYRMCRDIMSISSSLIYNGRLECANDTVANRIISIPNPGALSSFHGTEATCNPERICWLNYLCKASRRVVFANTDGGGAAARESLVSTSKHITNRFEAVVIAQLVVALQAQGIAGRDIGVIALYRSQIALLRELFTAANIGSEVEIDSADRFQGRDKECVIISMVRSNETGHVGDLIKDWRRLNVAFTRARSKLIIIGSRSTLKHNELMNQFIKLADKREWSMGLPGNVESIHGSAFDIVSQATGRVAALEAISQLSPSRKSPKSFKSPRSQKSPRKTGIKSSGSPSKALQPSKSGGNRGVVGRTSPISSQHKVVKRIDGRQKGRPFEKAKKMKENIAFEILEDLGAENWSSPVC